MGRLSLAVLNCMLVLAQASHFDLYTSNRNTTRRHLSTPLHSRWMSSNQSFEAFNATIYEWHPSWEEVCSVGVHLRGGREWDEVRWKAVMGGQMHPHVLLDDMSLHHLQRAAKSFNPSTLEARIWASHTSTVSKGGQPELATTDNVCWGKASCLAVLRNAMDHMLLGKVVVTYVQGEIRFNYTQQSTLCKCAQDLGASGILFLTAFPGPPNMYVNMHHGDSSTKCNLPALSAHMDPYMDMISQFDSSNHYPKQPNYQRHLNFAQLPVVEFDADLNPWYQLWGSGLFILIFKLILPVVNLSVLPVALYGIDKHIRNLRRTPTHLTYHFLTYAFKDSTGNWMLLGLILEFSSCLLRSVYLLGGALFSTGALTFVAQTHLRIAAPQEIMTIFISIMLFSRFNQLAPFGSRFAKKWFNTRTKFTFVFIWLSLLAATVYRNHLVASGGQNVDDRPIVIFMSGFQPLIVASTALLFLSEGVRFYQCLRHADIPSSGCQRAMRKAVAWLIVGGMAELAWLIPELIQTFGSLGAGGETSVLYSPWVVFALVALSLSALTTLSVCHVCAFLPHYKLWDAAMTSVSEQ